MGTYRFEYAKSGRAVCKHGDCKKNQVKIGKGELRQGVWVDFGGDGHASWQWRHWGCISPEIIKNITDAITDDDGEIDYDMLDGFEEMEAEGQDRIRKAIVQGHIEDEELTPGIHTMFNRPGGKAEVKRQEKEQKQAEKEREKAAKKALKDQEKAEKQALKDREKEQKKAAKESEKEANRLEKETAAGHKRKKSDSDTDDDRYDPPPASKKSRSTKSKVKVEEESDEDQKPKPARTRVKTEDKAIESDGDIVKEESDEDKKPKPGRTRTRARVKTEDGAPENNGDIVKEEVPEDAVVSDTDTKSNPAGAKKKGKPKSAPSRASANSSRKVSRNKKSVK